MGDLVKGYRLVPATHEMIVAAWPTVIRPGILEIKRHDKKSGHWWTTHVRQHLEAGFRGQLFCELQFIMPADSDYAVGFVVLKMYPDEFNGVADSLFVWLAYCSDPHSDVFPQVLPEIERRGRDLGVEYVMGISSRHGWARILKDYGYEEHQVSYRKPLYPEDKK